jgi:hypothetical protein
MLLRLRKVLTTPEEPLNAGDAVVVRINAEQIQTALDRLSRLAQTTMRPAAFPRQVRWGEPRTFPPVLTRCAGDIVLRDAAHSFVYTVTRYISHLLTAILVGTSTLL